MRRLPARAWLLISRGFDSLRAQNGTRDAAQVAFYVLMSFPAALLLVVWGASAALDDPSVKNDIVTAIVDALPLDATNGQSEVERWLDGIANGAGALGAIGAVSLFYSASGAIAALRHSVNQAWGVPDRPFVPGKALDLALTLAIVPLGLAGVGLILLRNITDALGDSPVFEGFLSFVLTVVVPLAVVFGALWVLLRVLPAERAGARSAAIGALAGVAGLVLVFVGTTLYFALAGNSNEIYGAIGALLAVSFSVYLGSIAVIYGAHVAAVASKLPSRDAIDRELDAGGEGKPLGTAIRDALRGLVFRRHGRDDDAAT